MRKLAQDRRLRRRIIAVFLGAVMLPSLILVYLGLQYIKREQQWQEQLVVRNMKTVLANAAHRVEESVNNRVRNAFDTLTHITALPGSISPLKIHNFLKRENLVQEVVVLDERQVILYPRFFGLRKRTVGVLEGISTEELRQRLVHAEELEARGKYEEASEELASGLKECATAEERLAFLTRIARCRYKFGDLAGSQRYYLRVLAEDRNLFLGEELPYRLIASLQLAEISARSGERSKAFEFLVQLYSDMLSGMDGLEQRQFEYYLSRVKNDLAEQVRHTIPAATRLDSLAKMEEIVLREPKSREFLETRVMPSVRPALLKRMRPDAIRYVAGEVSDSSLHYAFLEKSTPASGTRTIGIRLRCSLLAAFIADSLRKFNVGENLRIALLGKDGSVLNPTKPDGTRLVQEPLPLLGGTLRGYTLALLGIPGSTIQEFATSEVTLYYGLIFAIAVVIVLGVLFILHDISRDQELTRMKSEFISNVTHEIKTPIATIRSLAENVNEGWVTSADKQQEYFRLIAGESERLGHLVENTLDFSRIEAGRKQYRMDLRSPHEVLEKTVERFRMLTNEQGVRVSCNLASNLPLVTMDGDAIGQALLNLLDNAAKYSREKKEITLAADVEGSNLKIVVSDRGIGIDRRDIPRVFDKFYRSEQSGEKRVAGSGIGLTLVKEIAEAHGGRVLVESERNKGSIFTILIPIKRKEFNADYSAR